MMLLHDHFHCYVFFGGSGGLNGKSCLLQSIICSFASSILVLCHNSFLHLHERSEC